MEALVTLSLNNRLGVLLLWLGFCTAGVWSLSTLPLDAVPDLTPVQVQILTLSPGNTPDDIERVVTTAVERALGGTPRMIETRSLSRQGLSVVTAVFEDSTPLTQARQWVTERLGAARDAIPSGFGSPELGPQSTGLGEVVLFELTGPGLTPMALRETLDWVVRPRLLAMENVAEVISFGGSLKTWEATLDPKRMEERRVNPGDVVAALERTNRNAGGGVMTINDESLTVRGSGRLNGPDMADVVLRAEPGGGVLTLGQVAAVGPAPMLRHGGVTRDGKGEVVIGIVMSRAGANPQELARRVGAALPKIGEELGDVGIDVFYNRADLVERTMGTVAENLLAGAALVIAVLLLLMGSLRAGIIVALAVPLSFLGAVIGLRIMGLSGNLMSLGALDFGIIVDGSVVMVELIASSLALARAAGEITDKESRHRVVRRAATKMARPTAFAVAVIAVVYLPILSFRGIEGKMFTPMGWAVVFALAAALLCALTLTPVLAALWMKPGKSIHGSPVFRVMDAVFSRMLPWLAQRRWLVAGGALVLGVYSVMVFSNMGAAFLPRLEEGDLALQIIRQPEVSLSESLRQASMVEALLIEEFPEVSTVVSRTGRPELATDPMGMQASDVFVGLTPKDTWPDGMELQDLSGRMITRLSEVFPGIGFAASQPIELRVNELIEGVRGDVGVSIYGDDLERLDAVSAAIAAIIKGVPGAGDVEAKRLAGVPEMNIIVDRTALARHALDASIALDTINALAGIPAGAIFEDDRRFDVRVRWDQSVRDDVDAMSKLRMVNATGAAVPLAEVARLKPQLGPATIGRHQSRRRAIIEINVRGRDLVSFVKEAQERVAAAGVVPAEWHLAWGGQFQHFEAASKRLAVVVPLALALVLLLLYSAFGSMKRAAFIYLAVPFAACGGVLALHLGGYPFSISAAVGFISLAGIAVMNGVVWMTAAQELEERDGMSPREAGMGAAKLRLRAVMMTALTDIIGFLPMALSTSDGAEVQRPLATAVIGGILTATMLTLVVLPLMWGAFGGTKRKPA